MNTKRMLGLAFLVVLSACKGECSCGTDDDDGSTGVGGGTGGTDTVTVGNSGSTTGTGGTGGGTGGEGTGGDTTSAGGGGGGPNPIVDPEIRFLNVASNSEPVNFCLLDGDEFIGPLEASLESPAVSAYTSVNVGNYSVVLIGDGADCDDADAVVYEELPFADGSVTTVALIGNALDDANPLELAIYEDDLTRPAAGNTRLRFVHAAAGAPPVDIASQNEDGTYNRFFEGVAYGTDAGYSEEVPAFGPTTLYALAAGTDSELLPVPDVEGVDGAIVNAYAVGNVLDGNIDVAAFIFVDGAAVD